MQHAPRDARIGQGDEELLETEDFSGGAGTSVAGDEELGMGSIHTLIIDDDHWRSDFFAFESLESLAHSMRRPC
jgi:hypothetical protein